MYYGWTAIDVIVTGRFANESKLHGKKEVLYVVLVAIEGVYCQQDEDLNTCSVVYS